MQHACSACASEGCLRSCSALAQECRLSKIEGHVLLKAGFLFLVAYPEIKFRKCDMSAVPHKLSSGKTSPQQCKRKGRGICVL